MAIQTSGPAFGSTGPRSMLDSLMREVAVERAAAGFGANGEDGAAGATERARGGEERVGSGRTLAGRVEAAAGGSTGRGTNKRSEAGLSGTQRGVTQPEETRDDWPKGRTEVCVVPTERSPGRLRCDAARRSGRAAD